MTALLDVANLLKNHIAASFPAVRFATCGTPEEAVNGKSLPGGIRPPCVLILAGEGGHTDSTLTRRQQFHLILIDSLKGPGDARAAAVWSKFDELQALFPVDGMQSGEVVFLPESFRMLESADGRAAVCLTVAAMVPA